MDKGISNVVAALIGATATIIVGIIGPYGLLQQENSALQQENTSLQQENSELQEQTAEADNGNLQLQISTLQSENAKLLESNSNLNAQIEVLKSEKKQLEEEILTLRSSSTVSVSTPAFSAGEEYDLLAVCPPYEKNNRTSIYTGNNSFSMSGQQYRSGITMRIMEDGSWFLSNLRGEYSELHFDLGHVDGSGMSDVVLMVYLDNVLYETYTVLSSELYRSVTIPVSEVSQLKMQASYDNWNGYPTVGLGNIVIK